MASVSESESDHSKASESASGPSSFPAPSRPAVQIPAVIANWRLTELLGSGYSGSIYRAINIHNHQVVALKVQTVYHECPTNIYELNLYPVLRGGKGIPTMWAAGQYGEWDYLAIDLLGPSLDSLYRNSGSGVMDLGSVCTIAMQVIERLEFMHSRGVLHRDIQLGNCLIGLPPHDKTVYLIDFGFSKRYIDPYTNRHIPESKVKRYFIGNYWFSSVNVHCRGTVPSRRDDLEAAALMLIHLMTPHGLSWTRNGIPKTAQAHRQLKEEKRSARPGQLCRGMPPVFQEFLTYCRSLRFKDCPDYSRWKEEFRDLAVKRGYPDSDAFVWPPVSVAASNIQPTKPPRIRKSSTNFEVHRMTRDLQKLDLEAKQVLVDRTNVHELKTVVKDKVVLRPKKAPCIVNVGSANKAPPDLRMLKSYRLNMLMETTAEARDNAVLSKAVLEFVEVLHMNSSRTLTIEAFNFLDVLYKQLADPSVFIQPPSSRKTRSGNQSAEEREPIHTKLGVVARLRETVTFANSSVALATMVSDFRRVTSKSTGRNITKDGIAFLRGLAQRLEEIA